MGGVSEGDFRITRDKTLIFSGRLSLLNRGGFASIRTKPRDLNLNGYDTVAVHVKGYDIDWGDGKLRQAVLRGTAS